MMLLRVITTSVCRDFRLYSPIRYFILGGVMVDGLVSDARILWQEENTYELLMIGFSSLGGYCVNE